MIASICTFWATMMSLFFVVLPQRLGAPSLAAAPFLLVLIFGHSVDNHKIPSLASQPDPKSLFSENSKSLSQCFRTERLETTNELDLRLLNWINARTIKQGESTAEETIPLIIATSSGGGIRAAEFTAKSLNQLDRRTNGKFGDYIFAASTVSGASLGIATWAKARAIFGPGREMASLELLNRFYSHDFFGPVIGGMLLHDAAQLLFPAKIPGATRDQILEESWNLAWSAAIASFASEGIQSSTEGLGRLTDLGNIEPPLIIFNATEINSGKRFLVSGTALSNAWHPDAYIARSRCSLHGIRDMPLATAIHLSARFTFLSPAATIVSSPDKWAWEAYFARQWEWHGWGDEDHDWPSVPSVIWGQVVDGGYVENFGATTALETIKAIRDSWRRLRASGRLSNRIKLHILGLSLVNDPLDLGNDPLDREYLLYQAATNSPYPSIANDGESSDIQPSGERRFGSIWPAARSYDTRELRAMMGETTPIDSLIDNSLMKTESLVPIDAVLSAREARGLTAERQMKDYLQEMRIDDGIKDNSIGSWVDVRLGRLLRDSNSPKSGSDSLIIDRPSVGYGSRTFPNPQLAWRLSESSRDAILKALTARPDSPGRYTEWDDIQKAIDLFQSICEKSVSCSSNRGNRQ
ncbi:hypothetical protein KAK06_22070 [Ideonella sp. 4Y11]|uniref:PNPLA domain-containing protein n=1 Tax=Ideonella aquatica TaxID=2824119 RepID=A0A940YTN3_9BURK|nr:hypothetical protein [Ideonella aquatica]MBQ0961643.1 hypothetical protein [Ideonella aquatica]